MIELPVEANSHLEPPHGLARVVTRTAWIASTALGSLALVGWLLAVPTLYSGWPSTPHMAVNEALMFVLLGLALRLTMNRSRAHRPVMLTYRLGQVLAFLVAVAGALILIEYLLKRNFGIDERIIKDSSAAAYKGIPGRPSFPAALNGILLGLGTVLMDIRVRRIWLAQGLILMSVLITVQTLIGYACDVSELYGQAHTNEGNGMSVHDGFGFLLLGVGLLCARPDRGLLAIVSSNTPGGMLARWLLLTPVIGLLLSGTLYVLLERVVHADSTLRFWSLGLSNLVFLTVPIWVAAHLLHGIGLERDQAHHALEERVQQRTAELTRANAALAAEVAERREAEARTREERDFSDALVDSLPGVFYLFNAKGKLLRWNKNLERETGRSATDIAGLCAEDFFTGANRSLIAERIQDGFAKGETTAEVSFTAKDGRPRTYFFTGIRLDLRQGQCLVGLGLDITERKRAEEAVLDRDRELRLVMDSGPTLISYVDAECRYKRINRGYAEWYPAGNDHVLGLHIREVFGEEAWRTVEPYVARALAGEVVTFERELPLPSGPRWMRATYTPDRDPADQVRGFVVHAVDIGPQKRAEQALREARDRLEGQAAELERRVAERTAKLQETIGDLEAFSYSVAHDMRAPLRGMQGFARLLLEDHASQLDSEAHGYLERIASSASRMDMLILDVLNYTRVLQTRAHLVPVDLDRLVHHLIATYPDWQPPKVEIRIQGPLPAVLAHEGFLTQCVSNLVGNAVKFVAPGTVPRIQIWAEVANANVLIWFVDNGIGIEPKDRDRVFHMFERLNPSDQYEGTGIGLTIVRKAAERMGGRVGFDSEPRKGSKFWLELKAS